jgi:hypothetical protein
MTATSPSTGQSSTTGPTPTPGPWTVELVGQDDLYGRVYISGHITSPLHTYCGNDRGRKDSITSPDSMTRADAYLIAAAPELLAALDRFLGDECECGQEGVLVPCAYCQGWAAVAKAKGGAS